MAEDGEQGSYLHGTCLHGIHQELSPSSRIGIDPTLIPFSGANFLHKSFAESPATSTLVSVTENLIDQIWSFSRPARPANDIFQLANQYAGETVGQKLSLMREKLGKAGSPGMVVSQLDEVAWLFNLRGSDIPYNPVSLARPSLISRRRVFLTWLLLGLLRLRYCHS